MEERIVVVMGATGCGKSSLIKLATRDSNVVIGHSMKSETKSITSHSFVQDGTRITLVDTPGFDDTYLSDRDVLESVSKWLTTSYRQRTKISAILYVYRISDPRMQGSALRNFRIFRELCGADCFARITLCTTFWDIFKTNLAIPNARLEELKSPEFWGDMIKRGSKLTKAPKSELEAKRFFQAITRPESLVMQIQREVVDEGKSLDNTAAMLSFLDLELKRQREQHEQEMQKEKDRWQKEMADKEAQRNREEEVRRKQHAAEIEKLRVANSRAEMAAKRQSDEQAAQQAQLRKQMEQLERLKQSNNTPTHSAYAKTSSQFEMQEKNGLGRLSPVSSIPARPIAAYTPASTSTQNYQQPQPMSYNGQSQPLQQTPNASKGNSMMTDSGWCCCFLFCCPCAVCLKLCEVCAS